jgi:hypothetical protein
MSDELKLDDFVKNHVVQAIEKYVATILDDIQWQRDFEQRMLAKINDRLTYKLSTMYQDPVVIKTIQEQMHSLVASGSMPGISNYIDHDDLARRINAAIEVMATDMIQGITIDPDWKNRLEQQVNQRMTDRLLTLIHGINLNDIVKSELDRGIDRWHDRLAENFHTRGIADRAQQCELTVLDGAVVAQHGLACSDLLVEDSARIQGSLTACDLTVLGSINIDHTAFQNVVDRTSAATLDLLTADWKQSLVQQVLDLARDSGIDFNEIMINGEPIVQQGALNSSITRSNIQQLGTLQSLTVSGATDLGDTLSCSNHRVGINTQEPESALTVWDQEVCVLIGKQQKNSAFIGTSRKQNLEIGVNRQAEIVIDDQGITSIRRLRIDRWRIMFADQVPGWSGTRGDLVINSNPRPQAPWAWQCLGSYQWQPMGGNT